MSCALKQIVDMGVFFFEFFPFFFIAFEKNVTARNNLVPFLLFHGNLLTFLARSRKDCPESAIYGFSVQGDKKSTPPLFMD
jgi:hypothetical protein